VLSTTRSLFQSHFKQSRVDLKETVEVPNTVPPPPSGHSVYDYIIPASLAFQPSPQNEIMPLVAHLKMGFDQNRPRGWHRNDERRARGLWPVSKAAMQLQGWERELVWMEICILSGNSHASFRHLARAWGRDKGFHMVLAQFICQRRGNVERKKRPKGGGLKREEHPEEEFMNDILSFEDMDMPIPGYAEILKAMQEEDSDSEDQDYSVEENVEYHPIQHEQHAEVQDATEVVHAHPAAESHAGQQEEQEETYVDPLDLHLLMTTHNEGDVPEEEQQQQQVESHPQEATTVTAQM